jgi:hypothetical protein
MGVISRATMNGRREIVRPRYPEFGDNLHREQPWGLAPRPRSRRATTRPIVPELGSEDTLWREDTEPLGTPRADGYGDDDTEDLTDPDGPQVVCSCCDPAGFPYMRRRSHR